MPAIVRLTFPLMLPLKVLLPLVFKVNVFVVVPLFCTIDWLVVEVADSATAVWSKPARSKVPIPLTPSCTSDDWLSPLFAPNCAKPVI